MLGWGLCNHCGRIFRRREDGDTHCAKCARGFVLATVVKALQAGMDLTLKENLMKAGYDKFKPAIRKALSEFSGLELTSDELLHVWNFFVTEPHPIGRLLEQADEPQRPNVVETESVKHGRGGFEVR